MTIIHRESAEFWVNKDKLKPEDTDNIENYRGFPYIPSKAEFQAAQYKYKDWSYQPLYGVCDLTGFTTFEMRAELIEELLFQAKVTKYIKLINALSIIPLVLISSPVV